MKTLFFSILLCILTVQIISCGENNKTETKTDLQFAEDFIEKMEPQKAVPFLTSIKPDSPDFQRAQELLKTIGSVYGSTDSTTQKPKTENESSGMSNGGKEQNKQISPRQRNIERQFSAWDGSHYEVEKYIKKNMNNPDSYEHVETSYSVQKNYLIVLTTFRGTNSFGAIVTNQMKVKVALDEDGNPQSLKEIEL